MGFATETTSVSGDGGIDIVATNDQPLVKEQYIIQCKQWKAPVGEPPLRDLYGLVVSSDAIKGVLMTTSTFTPQAKRFARGKRLELIDGAAFQGLMERFTGTQSPVVTPSSKR